MQNASFIYRAPSPPPATNDIFFESVVKLYCARLHIEQVSKIWERTIQKHADAVADVKLRPEDGSFDPLRPRPTYLLPLMMGNAIRNLRSTLDYLVSALAREAGLSDAQTIFPFADKRTGIQSSFNEPLPGDKARKGRKAGALYEVSRRYPDLETVILDRVQPYSADDGAGPGGDLIWRLVTSDNIDKHRLMTTIIHHTHIGHIAFGKGSEISGIETIGPVLRLGPDTEFQGQPQLAFDILFAEPARLANRPVVSTLVEASNIISQTIETFEAYFKRG